MVLSYVMLLTISRSTPKKPQRRLENAKNKTRHETGMLTLYANASEASEGEVEAEEEEAQTLIAGHQETQDHRLLDVVDLQIDLITGDHRNGAKLIHIFPEVAVLLEQMQEDVAHRQFNDHYPARDLAQ